MDWIGQAIEHGKHEREKTQLWLRKVKLIEARAPEFWKALIAFLRSENSRCQEKLRLSADIEHDGVKLTIRSVHAKTELEFSRDGLCIFLRASGGTESLNLRVDESNNVYLEDAQGPIMQDRLSEMILRPVVLGPIKFY